MEPVYIRLQHHGKVIPGPVTECGEDNLWQIHEFTHEISGKPSEDLWSFSHWDAKHKVMKTVLEVGDFLPGLYSINVINGDYLNRVEIFWCQYNEEYKKHRFYFRHTIFPVKITAITLLMPDIKNELYENYNHLVSIEFRYRFIEHLFVDGYLYNKSEWLYFFIDESWEPIPENYLTGRCLSHEALEWKDANKQDESQDIIFEFIDFEENLLSGDTFHFQYRKQESLCSNHSEQGALSISLQKHTLNDFEIIHIPEPPAA